MDHLLHYLKKEVTYASNSGVIYVDLPKDAKISMLMLEIRMQCKSGSHDVTNSVLHCVEKIHVLLDGAKIAYSMQPEVASYDYFLRSGSNPPHELVSYGGDQDHMRLPVLFGRYPGDLEYGLDTARYGSAAIEIEYTLDTDDYTDGSTLLTAWIMVPVVPSTYKGFIRSRVIEDKATPTASSVHTVDFPSTYPLLAAFCRIYDKDKYPTENVTDLDFQADQGRYRIFQGRIEDLLYVNDIILGRDLEGPLMLIHVQDADEPVSFMGLARAHRINPFYAGAYHCASLSIRGHDFMIELGNGGTGKGCFCQAFGAMPWGCLLLGDWRNAPFDAPRHADLKCDFTIGGTTPEFLTTCVLEVVAGVL